MESLRAGAVVSLVLCTIFFASSSVEAASNNSLEDIIPSSLAVPEGNHVQQVLFATGVQIYIFNGTTSAWVLNNVSADLYNFKGIKVGHHFFLAHVDVNGGQPTWETFHPFTRVTAKRVAAVSPQSDSIAWLLLKATTNAGKVFFGLTTYVQRLFTQHGLPPAVDGSAQAGDVYQSNYTALYVFSAANSTANSTAKAGEVFQSGLSVF